MMSALKIHPSNAALANLVDAISKIEGDVCLDGTALVVRIGERTKRFNVTRPRMAKSWAIRTAFNQDLLVPRHVMERALLHPDKLREVIGDWVPLAQKEE